MAAQKFSINFTADEILNVSVYKSKGGYNYIDIGVKMGKDQYMRINHEWEGEMTPDFVMDLLGTFAPKPEPCEKPIKKAKASLELEQEFKDFVKRVNESTETL